MSRCRYVRVVARLVSLRLRAKKTAAPVSRLISAFRCAAQKLPICARLTGVAVFLNIGQLLKRGYQAASKVRQKYREIALNCQTYQASLRLFGRVFDMNKLKSHHASEEFPFLCVGRQGMCCNSTTFQCNHKVASRSAVTVIQIGVSVLDYETKDSNRALDLLRELDCWKSI